MPSPPQQAFERLLKDVSRSFYLTMRILPGRVRPQIGLAYLLARATDTIADTEVIPVAGRLRELTRLRERILGQSAFILDFSQVTSAPSDSITGPERLLLERMEEAIGILGSLAPMDQERIRSVLDTITGGQLLDLERFGNATAGRIIALQTDAELDDYTYRVAGSVGRFWTQMCRAHLFPAAAINESRLVEKGVRFGKGLQLVNILRDLPADLASGRCYIPEHRLEECGLTPSDLLSSTSESRFKGLYHHYLDLTQSHLSAGWDYTIALPFRQARLRLACAWPLLIGAATVRKLRTSNVLDRTRRIKVGRDEVRSLILRSILWYPWPGKWNRLFQSV